MNPLVDIEEQIQRGTRLLSPIELAPRMGFAATKEGARSVMKFVKAGKLPAFRPNARVVLFHWPTVVEAVAKSAAVRRKIGRLAAIVVAALSMFSSPVADAGGTESLVAGERGVAKDPRPGFIPSRPEAERVSPGAAKGAVCALVVGFVGLVVLGAGGVWHRWPDEADEAEASKRVRELGDLL